MTIITKTSELEALCKKLSGAPYIALDTEFIREKTYYPRLCLIQVAGPDDVAAIDPLAKGIKLTPFYELLADANVLKVLHASRQDIEIFYHMAGFIPMPIFDTQIAAMVCGYGESVGYEPLVSKVTGTSLDKSQRFTDWSQRPLSEKQISYALADVIHLRPVYEKLVAQIESAGRMHWIREEMHEITKPSLYETNPDEVWHKLRFRNRTPKYLALLRAVAKWRELEARKQDVPRARIIKDETLLEVASAAPVTAEEIKKIRGFGNHLKAAQITSLLTTIEQAKALPSADHPRLSSRRPASETLQGVIDLLRLLLKIKCDEHGVAHRLVASSEDLEAIALGKYDDVPAMQGWRYTIFGEYAEKLVKGKLSLSVDPKTRGVRFTADV